VKRLASALALACLLAACAVAGPALSTSPYRPKAVDFEVAPRAKPKATSARGLVSGHVRAPKRFNLVGIRWRGRAEPRLSIRTRRNGRRWTRWARLDTHADDGPDAGTAERTRGVSSPAWVGEADQVQYRASRRLPGLRLHFVNVNGTATAADRALSAVRGAANTAVVSLGRALGAAPAGAQVAQPAIVPRAGWGASACPPRSPADYGTVQAAYVHHTVNLNDYSREEAPRIVLAICRYHRNSNGWNDIGYNFLVDRYGTIYEGRAGGINQAVVGAQAQGYNGQTTGIANIGTFSDVPQTPEGLQAMARLIRWKLPLHGVPTTGTTTLRSGGGSTNRYPSGALVRVERVIGHRDTGSTECPGNALYAQIPELRRLVAGAGGPATGLTTKVFPRRLRYGRAIRVTGDLLGVDGTPLAGRRLQAQVRLKRRWRTVALISTGADGHFNARLVMKVSRVVRTRFPGDSALPPAASPRTKVAVRPLFVLRAPPLRGRAGRRLRVRGRVRPAKRRIYLVLKERVRGRFRTVGVKPVRPRRGRFSTWIEPAGRGLYRFHLVARADRSNALGRSRRYLVRVGG
jgi:N-acetylmuramoyl-L-alanine amidase-like protein